MYAKSGGQRVFRIAKDRGRIALFSALFLAALPAPALAQGPAGEDTATGSGVGRFDTTFTFDARSAPAGEGATGSMTSIRPHLGASGGTERIVASVRCLTVRGNRAMIAGAITESNSPAVSLQVGGGIGFAVLDGGTPGTANDRFASYGTSGANPVCGEPTLEMFPITGEIVVADAPDLRDTTGPVLTVPGSIVVDATGPSGAAVSFSVSARDDQDPNPAVSCDRTSGSVFAIGTTTVTCAATDAAGNRSTATFQVRVRGAAEQIDRLIDRVAGQLPLSPAVKTPLVAHLKQAAAHADTPTKCRALAGFVSAVRFASARGLIPAATASELIADAERIRRVLAC